MARTASLKSIERQIRELEMKAEALREKPGIRQIKVLISKHRLRREDVEAIFDAKPRKAKGGTVKPKYRNPEDRLKPGAAGG